MRPDLYVLGVPNFANYEATAALIRVPRAGGAVDYVSIGEDRLTRTKHTYAFPLRGIHYCLQAFGLESLDEVDLICTDYARLPRWLNSGPGYRKLEHDYLKLRLNYPVERVHVVDHHDAHAASAFYPSPFQEAAVLVVDSLGSRLNTQTLYHFDGGDARVLERGDHWGIGRIYSLVTGSVLPYGPEKGFGKTMGLAPYGRVHPGPVLEFDVHDSGMSSDYSAFASRPPLPRIVAPGVRRCEDREQVLDPYFARAAFDVQQECERQMLRMARYAYEQTGSRNLCIAGGVALNGLANARVVHEGPFERVWVPPGCSDTGLSLGLALWGYYQRLATGARQPKVTFSMRTAYSGLTYAQSNVIALLEQYGIAYRRVEPEAVAPFIADGRVIAWFEGASESGPRALGHRSINADPRDPQMKDTLNRRVKFREGYRPYAPSVLAEHAAEWLNLAPSPAETSGPDTFMLLVVDVREDKRTLVPAITHVDGTTRPQTVTLDANPHYYRMIQAFFDLTGVPMVLNTSLNINREPIVETPIDALICAFGTAIDVLYIEGLLVECAPYATPEMVKQLTADRARILDEEWAQVTSRYLTKYDVAERDAYLAEANKIAEWHRNYRAKYELETHIDRWSDMGARLLIVGTRGHTRCLYRHIDRFHELTVSAFVPMDDRPGEQGEFSAYRELAFDQIDWRSIDAVLISTHEYQHEAAAAVSRIIPREVPVVALYDDAGDSLLHVLPGHWPVVRELPDVGVQGTARSPRPVASYDFEAPPPREVANRYALIVCYHYCHPADGFLRGTKSITPDEFERHLRVLKQNFICTTIGSLMNPDADLPETVAVVTFDDGFKDVAEFALPLLRRWEIPATIYCNSAPLTDGRLLDVHRVHMLQAKLGTGAFRAAFLRAVETHPGLVVEPTEHLRLENLYPYDDAATRQFKRLLNFDLPYATSSAILADVFQSALGNEREYVERLYMSEDDLHRCQDGGLEIGIHGHEHRTLSRLTEAQQRAEMRRAAEYFRSTFGLGALHFSYPYGAVGTWNATSRSLLEALGFASAVTKVRTIVKPRDLTARWEIPRYDVRDVFDATGCLDATQLQALFTAE
jgi:carbamoyltransferase